MGRQVGLPAVGGFLSTVIARCPQKHSVHVALCEVPVTCMLLFYKLISRSEGRTRWDFLQTAKRTRMPTKSFLKERLIQEKPMEPSPRTWAHVQSWQRSRAQILSTVYQISQRTDQSCVGRCPFRSRRPHQYACAVQKVYGDI